MNERFIREREDSQSTDALKQYFSDAFEDLEVSGALDALSCAETLCRVNVHFGDMAAAVRFRDGADMGDRVKSMDIEMADGQLDVEVFLARE